MTADEERGWDTLRALGGGDRTLALAAKWEAEANRLAPQNDWGDSVDRTVWSDCLRACAADLRAAVRADPTERDGRSHE